MSKLIVENRYNDSDWQHYEDIPVEDRDAAFPVILQLAARHGAENHGAGVAKAWLDGADEVVAKLADGSEGRVRFIA
jgi:hypothetical protein